MGCEGQVWGGWEDDTPERWGAAPPTRLLGTPPQAPPQQGLDEGWSPSLALRAPQPLARGL